MTSWALTAPGHTLLPSMDAVKDLLHRLLSPEACSTEISCMWVGSLAIRSDILPESEKNEGDDPWAL